MTEIHFSTATIISYGLAGVFYILFPFILGYIWRKISGETWFPLIIGLVTFYAAAIVRIMVRALAFGEGSFLRGNSYRFYFWQAVLSGTVEELAKYLAFRYPLKNKTGRTVPVMYGIGHDGMEVVTVVGIGLLHYVFYAIDCNSLGAESFTEGLSAEEAENMLAWLADAADYNILDFIQSLFNNVIGALQQIVWSVFVFTAVQRSEKKWLFIAIGLHALADMVPILDLLGIFEGGEFVVFDIIELAISGFFAYKVYKELPYA